ncbi:MAG TPA: hypothetical protein VH117_06875 [Edaphobacter sp.]|jgi:hypothetical protein|nr:hypothetical protein [Edaphobacter sp.]
MIGTPKIHGWKVLALFATILALLLLLLPQAANHHAAALVFLLVPIFLFGLLDTLAWQRLSTPSTTLSLRLQTRPSLFQRPPPVLA